MRVRGIVLLALLAAPVLADGKVFSRVVANVETPDQRAILRFDGGRETLVIETSHDGEGTEFAWVVPTPAVPEVRAVTPGVFRTLEVIVRPEVVDDTPALYLWIPVVVGLAAVLAYLARRTGQPVAVLLAALLVLVAILFFVVILIPKGSFVAQKAAVHQRGRVGAYEFASVSAEKPDDLRAWLTENGFRISEEAKAAVDAYVAEGWVFTVGRLTAARGARPHPLAFEFPADQAIYPLRLTGAGQGPMTLDLYVFADRKAIGEPLSRVHCAEVNRSASKSSKVAPPDPDDELTLVHSGLVRISGDSTVLTKLSGTLRPEDMRRDLVLRWEDFSPEWTTLHTVRAARTEAANAAVGFLLVALLLSRFARRGRGIYWTGSILIAAGLGVGILAVRETVEAGTFDWMDAVDLRHQHELAADELPRDQVVGMTQLRQLAAARWKGRTNPFTGEPVREEDSPGNYLVEERDGRPIYVYFDARGLEVVPPAHREEPERDRTPRVVFVGTQYLPMGREKPGKTTWRYRMTRGVESSEVSFEGWFFERRAFPGAGLQDAYNQIASDGRSKNIYFDREEWFLLEGFHVHGLLEHYDPPIRILPQSGQVGEAWQWSGTLNGERSGAEIEVKAAEEIRTAHGRLSCLRTKQFLAPQMIRIERWFAKGIGLARLVRTVRGKEELRLELIGFQTQSDAR